jgi:hypothetical protein
MQRKALESAEADETIDVLKKDSLVVCLGASSAPELGGEKTREYCATEC